MSDSKSTTGGNGLVLSVRDKTGREELRVQLQKMNIGSGEADTISAEGVSQAHASIVRNPIVTGGYRVKVNHPGSFIFDETTQADVTGLDLEAGVSFRVGGTTIHCAGEAPRNPESDDWATGCPFCSATMDSQVDSDCPSCGRHLKFEEHKAWSGWVPEKIGPYQVKKFVGCGGMGVVLRGMDDADLPIAIKLIRSRFPNPNALAKFDDEIAIIKKMPAHPNIVSYRGHGSEEERLRWLAMEWIEGETLDERISKAEGHILPIAEISSIMRQLVSGLEHLHSNAIVHRDLKPGNIFVKPDAGVKICDFGIARAIDANTVLLTTANASGTPFYSSPEQRAGQRIDVASDIYSLGLVWQEMLTGHNTGGLLTTSRKDCPAAWKEIIRQMLEITPDQRPGLTDIGAAIRMQIELSSNEKPVDHGENLFLHWCMQFVSRGKRFFVWAKPRTMVLARGTWQQMTEAPGIVRTKKRQEIRAWVAVSILFVASCIFLRKMGWLGPEEYGRGVMVMLMTFFGLLPPIWMDFRSRRNKFSDLVYRLFIYTIMFLALFAMCWCTSKLDRMPKLSKIKHESQRITDAGEERTFAIAPGVNMTFCWIPPGEFLMGSPKDEPGRFADESQSRVVISDGFWMGKTEVTQAQWKEVIGRHKSKNPGKLMPVENVSWTQAKGFVTKLNSMGVKPEGWRFALPTVEQWEYACRAGTTTAGSVNLCL